MIQTAKWSCGVLAVIVCSSRAVIAADSSPHISALGELLPLSAILPFAGMLLAIALFPLAAPHWWEKNRNKGIIAFALAGPLAAYLIVQFGEAGAHQLGHKFAEYVSFIALLGALYVTCGGICVRGSLSGTPLVNTGLLALGAVIANFVGTTGASILLIRPLLRANASRQKQAHIVVFFIFIVSNCGGLLTPLGDPPLFLGFLEGVPFEWTAVNLWKPWIVVNVALLVIFNVFDQFILDKEEKERAGSQLEELMQHEPLQILGLHNFAFLAGIVLVIFAAGKGWGASSGRWPTGVQEGLLILLGLTSYVSTSRKIHSENGFSFGPINEVAILFAGIFITMTPALLILNARGAELGVDQPWEYFWSAGVLSSFLDNAPTYLTFASAACGAQGIDTAQSGYMASFLALPPDARAAQVLAAISCGAVFMGANTYIGNGPNFMVKAIAEQAGVRMPGFFGYMGYAGAILIPLFVVVTLIFFR